MKLNQPAEKKYYLGYLRKSSEDEDRQVQSIPDQRKVLDPLVQDRKFKVLEWFEEAKSAKAPGRPEFNRMIDLINSRDDIKGIITWKLNRCSRNPVDSGTLQWILQNGKIVEIVTPSKTYTEVDSDFIMSVEAAQSNRFIRDLREDTWRGMKSKLEKGMAPLLASPGYKNDTTKKQGERDIIPDPVQFPLMRKLFDEALSGKYSISDLYQMAKDMGIKTNRGKEISRSRMSEIIHNIFYTGKFVYRGELYDGIHKPMLTFQEYELLQEIFSERDRPRPKKYEQPLPGNVLRCVCGRALSYEPKVKKYKNGKVARFTYLRCNRKFYQPNPLCPRSSININDLNKQMVKLLGTIRISPKLVEWGIERLNEKNDEKRELRDAQHKALKESYDGVVLRLENLLQLKVSPQNVNGSLLSDVEYAEQRLKLIGERDKLDSNLKALNDDREEWAKLTVSVFNFAARAQDAYENGSWEKRRDICRIFGTSLVLNGKKLEIMPRTPFSYIHNALESPELEKVPVNRPIRSISTSTEHLGVLDDQILEPICAQNTALRPLFCSQYN